MNKIVTKTEDMITLIQYNKINFASVMTLALGQISHGAPEIDEAGDIVATLNLRECAEFLGYKTENLSDTKDVFSRLIKNGAKECWKTIENSKDRTAERILITSFDVSAKYNYIKISFNKTLMNNILVTKENKTRYITYDFSMFKNCSKADTLALYELFKLYSFKQSGVFDITFDNIKRFLNIEHRNVPTKKGKRKLTNETYMDYNLFKKKILSPSIKYINENTDLKITIIKENRKKHTYSVNNEEKVITTLDKIWFKIEEKKDFVKTSTVINDISVKVGASYSEIEEKVNFVTKTIGEYGIDVDFNQIAVLTRLCLDFKLVKYVLLEAYENEKIIDKGAFAYSRIIDLVENKETESYKTIMADRFENNNKNKEDYSLTKEQLANEDLVNICELYKLYSGRLVEQDVDGIIRCLSKHNTVKIIAAINALFPKMRKKGKTINSFKFIEYMLDKGTFVNKNKKENQSNKRNISLKNSAKSGDEMIQALEEQLGSGKIVDFDKIFN